MLSPAVGQLGPNDLVTVLTELCEVCAQWYYLGLVLNLTPDVLDAIKGPFKSDKDCLRDVVLRWLKTSGPSWEALVQALRSPIVDTERLARHLEQKYCVRGLEPPISKEATHIYI